VQALEDEHFTCLNHGLMKQLSTIGQASYMRLFFHFANLYDGRNRKQLVFAKRYDDNGQDAEAFDGRIEFSVKLLPYTGNDQWIESVLVNLKSCLMSNNIPDQPDDCEFCGYSRARAGETLAARHADSAAQ